jgi:M6 family metalloprotease-like protein
LVIALTNAPLAFGVPAIPQPFVDMQPDGTEVILRVRGDEHFNWTEDLDGYTVIRHRGWFEYARVEADGRLGSSNARVGLDSPRAFGLLPGLLPSRSQRAATAKTLGSSAGNATSAQATVPAGTIRNLVVLVQFSDHVGRPLPTTSELDILFNAPGGDPVLAPTGSIRDVYLENSYGQMELNSDVMPWVTVFGSERYYANGESGDETLWEALREALDILDASVDFGQYDLNGDGAIDSITFLHSGYGAEFAGSDYYGTYFLDRIWSHRWAMQSNWVSAEGVAVRDYHISPSLWSTYGSRIAHIGVIAHETGHFFGLPDLYDVDGGGSGIGAYGLMASSWGFDNTQLCPSSFSPWSKIQLGWINPVHISEPGEYSLAQSASTDEYFVISQGYASGEYLIIENRQRTGFDCALPQGGLAVWHIDEAADFDTEGYPGGRWPKDGKHYRVALAQADGNFQLEQGLNRGDAGDVHHALGVDAIGPGPGGHPNTDGYQKGRIVQTGHTLSNIGLSGPVMTFCFNGCGDGGSPDTYDGFEAPSELTATVVTSGNGKNALKTVTLSWADNSNGVNNEDSFVIERCEEVGNGKSKACEFSTHATVGQDIVSFSEPAGSGTYRYRVKARQGSGEDTGYSNEVKI